MDWIFISINGKKLLKFHVNGRENGLKNSHFYFDFCKHINVFFLELFNDAFKFYNKLNNCYFMIILCIKILEIVLLENIKNINQAFNNNV